MLEATVDEIKSLLARVVEIRMKKLPQLEKKKSLCLIFCTFNFWRRSCYLRTAFILSWTIRRDSWQYREAVCTLVHLLSTFVQNGYSTVKRVHIFMISSLI